MQIRPLRIDGAWEVTPRQFPDDRGVFLESFRRDLLSQALGRPFEVVQSNVSVSSAGTVRGIHFADVPPSQAKYVTALGGSFIDFIVDVRIGSPTFGEWDSVVLDTVDRRAVFLSEGLGHALCALADDSTVMYLLNAPYAPSREHGIHPLDPGIALAIPPGLTPVLSPKDAAAPTLAQARDQGLLPDLADVTAYLQTLG